MDSKALEQYSLIGIDLGATNVRVARIRGERIEQIETEKIVESGEPSDLLNQIQKLINQVNQEDVNSIGIGVPSVVDVEEGIVYDVQNISSWNKVPVKSILENAFDIPVYVNNDANCFVLGEKFFGKGQGYESIVGLTLGSGFGSGLMLDNRLYVGENCGAGEIGMFPYKDSIFEHYCSGMFFERQYGMSGDRVYEKAEQGNPRAKKIYQEFGKHLGNAIKTVMYSYDPQLIILGGSIRKASSYFIESMYNAMQDFAYQNSLESLKIEISELDDVAVLGAGALALDSENK